MLTQNKEDMQLEIEHLHSHEERLAVLHRELENEKINVLVKIKENDRLIHEVSKIEMQMKKALLNNNSSCSPHRSWSPDIHDSNERSLLSRQETMLRSRLAIA